MRRDLTGQRFGKLYVESFCEVRSRKAYWNVVCDCGNRKVVSGNNLVNHATKSCGCVKGGNHTHGESKTRLYGIWAGMHQRCENENRRDYAKYGGSGISVCDEWTEYSAFAEWAKANGYDDSKSIDRIDPNLGYFPGNCRWVSFEKQQNNKSNSCLLTVRGETKTAAEWAAISGVPAARIRRRKKAHWPDEQAVFEPIDESHKHGTGGA